MGRGDLRIYLGAAPGVGKTFAMLNEGGRRSQRGTDVVIGVVETHGRQHTIDEIRELEIIPSRMLAAASESTETSTGDLDLAAVLHRRPGLPVGRDTR